MRVEIVKKEDVKLSNREEKILQRKVEKLKRILSDFINHEPTLRIEIDRSNRTHEFMVKAYLHLPGNTDITASNTHNQLAHALDGLFKALTKEAKRRKEKIIESHRIEKEQKLAYLMSQITPEAQRSLKNIRPELIRFAKRMAIAHLMHDWETLQYIDVEELVDEAIERAAEEGLLKSFNINKKLLFQKVAEVLKEEIETITEEKEEEVSIEEDVPLEPPEEEVSDMGSEILDFYQPDAWLKLEDLIPAINAEGELEDVPDLEALKEEISERIKNILPRFSPLDRKILTLFIFDELEPYEIAMVLGKKTEEVRERLINSLNKLLKELKKE